MSVQHLSTGSVDPPRIKGLLRLYSMIICPYAQRSRLILRAKEIPHEIVNINLINKPEWYSKIHSEQKVPALIDGSKIIVESLDISDYLDEKYPNNPLYPSDPQKKQQDKDLIKKIAPVLKVFYWCLFTDEKISPVEWIQKFLEVLQVFEDELMQRSTPFFGGNNPGMVDYMLWPWAERAPCVAMKLSEHLPVTDSHIPLLRKWSKRMMKDPVCADLYMDPEITWKVVEKKIQGDDYTAMFD